MHAENGGTNTTTVKDHNPHRQAMPWVTYPSMQQYHRNVNQVASYPLHPAHTHRRPQPGHQRRRNRPRQIKSKLSHETAGETHTRKNPNLKFNEFNDDYKLRKKRSVAYDEDEENEGYGDEGYDDVSEGYDEQDEESYSGNEENYGDRHSRKNRAVGYDHEETEALDPTYRENGSVRYGHRSNGRLGKC